MSHADYRVELTGKILAGRNEKEVADALARLFKADADKVRRIFPGRLITIKTGLAEHAATRYRAAIEQAGAECRVVAESAPGAPPTEVPGVDSAPRAALDPGLVAEVMKVLPLQDPHRADFALAAMRLWLNELDAKEAVVAAVETEHYALLESDRARAHAAYAWMRRLNAARRPFLAEPAFAPSPVTSPAAQRAEIDRVLDDKSLSCYVSGLELVEHPGAPGQQGHALRLGLGEGYLWVSWASDPEWVRRLTGTTGSELRLRLRLDCVTMVDIRAEGSTPGAGSRRLRLRLHVPLPVSVGDSAGGVRKLDFDCASTGFETCGLGVWNRGRCGGSNRGASAT